METFIATALILAFVSGLLVAYLYGNSLIRKSRLAIRSLRAQPPHDFTDLEAAVAQNVLKAQPEVDRLKADQKFGEVAQAKIRAEVIKQSKHHLDPWRYNAHLKAIGEGDVEVGAKKIENVLKVSLEKHVERVRKGLKP